MSPNFMGSETVLYGDGNAFMWSETGDPDQ